tara:strand:+ start:990 stop:2897 length:1908 start_codon:yes stop_codon:yes gene_type:complete
MAKSDCDPDEIMQAVKRHEDETESLRERMEEDYDIYRLTPFDAGDGYQDYTSNDPQTYADKIIGWLSAHRMIINVPHRGDHLQEREQNDNKERFLIGLLKAVDEELTISLEPKLQHTLASMICLRGWYAGRALLAKDEDDDTTYVSVQPWDPMHTYWSMGKRGLDWACYKTRRTLQEISAEYPDFELDEWTIGDQNPDEFGLDVYDYYDRDQNCVVIQGQFAKKPQDHGAGRVPVFLGMVGAMPRLQGRFNGRLDPDMMADYGESVFKSNRELYKKHNFTMSVMMEMVARAQKQTVLVRSRDGSKSLDEDPYVAGSEISLAEGENVEPLGLLEVARETSAYMGLVSGEIQRGSLPFSVYGQLDFQLSGFAINTLRQGIQTVLEPRLDAMRTCYTQICNLLSDQYSSGSFDAIELSGFANNRQWFSEEITYDMIEGVGAPEINFVGNLPQDEMSKMSMAQMAREGPVPLIDDRTIRDEILGLQSADEVENQIKEQMGEQILPEAQMWTILKATEERGRSDLAQFYMGQLQEILMQKQAMQQQMMMQMSGAGPGMPDPGGAPPPGAPGPGGLPPSPAGPGGAGPGLRPEVMPNAGLGVPPPTPTPQAGPNVPPGSPRPGGQNEVERLRRAGLFGPRG